MDLFSLGSHAGSVIGKYFLKKNEPSKNVRMCVVGLDNAGKTTILKALSDEEIQYVMPT